MQSAPLAPLVVCGLAASMLTAEVVASPPTEEVCETAEFDARAGAAEAAGVWTDEVIIQVRATEVDKVKLAGGDPALEAVCRRWGVVSLRPAVDPPARDAALAARLGLDRYYIVTAPVGTDARALAAELAGLTHVLEKSETAPVGRLHTTPSDPGFGEQWGLYNVGQTAGGVPGSDIDWLPVWQMERTLAEVVVAVLDSGVSYSHPDLQGRTVPGRCFICGTGDPTNTDDRYDLSHGTQCAGIIAAATNNGTGIAGIAPNARIMPLKVAGGLVTSPTATGNGLVWAADNGAAIASMSWSFGTGSNVSFLRTAVEYAHQRGVLMVASTGNTPGAPVGFPAQWDEVIAVGATTASDGLWPATTTGPQLDVCAPGENIYTTFDQSGTPDGYNFASGTSMAAPMVAGVAALVRGVNPMLNAAQVRAIIEGTVEDLGPPGWDSSFGFGRVNAAAAVAAAMVTLPPCRPDVNGDGLVELGDLFDFLQEYFNATGTGPARFPADFDGSGVVSVDDLFSYMAAYFVGC